MSLGDMMGKYRLSKPLAIACIVMSVIALIIGIADLALRHWIGGWIPSFLIFGPLLVWSIASLRRGIPSSQGSTESADESTQ
jgi:hypothetical protein